MTENNAAQAAEQDPMSDEYVNAVIRQHGYDSPETVIARLWQWIGLNGSENGVTLLMYEAHKALSKLRAEGVQAGDERERGYAENAAFRVWWDENQACPEHSLTTENAAHAAWQERERRAIMASAPVAGEAHMPPGYRVKAVDGHGYRITPPTGSDWVAHSDTPAGDLIAALVAAPQASEAVRDVLAELVRLQDAKDSQAHLPNPQRSNEWAEYRRLWPVAMEEARAALKTQADKAGGDCAKGAGELQTAVALWLELKDRQSHPHDFPGVINAEKKVRRILAALAAQPAAKKKDGGHEN